MSGRIRSSLSLLTATAMISVAFAQPLLAAAPPAANRTNDSTLHVCRADLERLDQQLQLAAKTKSKKKIPFNGELVYCRALEAILQDHVTLGDKQARVDFINKWLHHFDTTGELKTSEGVDDVLPEVVESLGQRFDGYMTEAAFARMKQEMKGEKVGIGSHFLFTRKASAEELARHAAQAAPAAPQAPGAQQAPEQQIPDFVKDALEKSGAVTPAHWDSHVAILSVDADGPSAGLLQPGDLILELNGRKGNEITPKDVAGINNGEAGTKVTIKVRRMDNGKLTDVTHTIVRKAIEEKTVTWRDLGDGITLIVITEFMNEKAPEQLHEALEHGAKGKATIVSVRGNPGGELQKAIEMTGEFINSGTVVTIRYREGSGFRDETYSVGPDYKEHVDHLPNGKLLVDVKERAKPLLPADMPVIFLTNNGSASASEIAAGAVQTLKRAKVVGRPSLGKGEGQTVVPLPYGRAIRVTSFEFLPGGKAMNWVGIIPDVEVDLSQSTPGHDLTLETAIGVAKEEIAAKEAREKHEKELFERNHQSFDEERNEN